MRLQFLACYDALRKRLKYRLGSEDLAHDVLHETWLRIEHRNSDLTVQNPQAYLYRAALNVAYDQHQKEPRLLSLEEVEDILLPDEESQDPVRISSAREEINALQQVLRQLPYRQREILIASRLEDVPHREIAQRYRISTRMVEKELKSALTFLQEKMQRKVTQRFGPKAIKTSE